MHGNCHLAKKQKSPSENAVGLLLFSSVLVQWKKAVDCLYVCCLLEEGRRDGRPTFPGLSLDSAGHPLSWCRCASYVAGNLVHSVTSCTHCACTDYRASPVPRGGGSYARAPERAHTYTHVEAHASTVPRPLTSLAERNPIGFRTDL